jgi:tRNA pseudouridine55 synthase
VLAHDIGAALGCGGTIERLTRLAVGDFVLEHALDLAEATAEQLTRQALSIDRALAFLPAVLLDAAQARAARHGNGFAVAAAPASGHPLRLRHDGRLLAIGSCRDGTAVHPDVVFEQETAC